MRERKCNYCNINHFLGTQNEFSLASQVAQVTQQHVTHHVRRARPVGVAGAVSCAPVGVVVGVAVLGAALPLVYHQVDRHLPLQAGDVPVAEVVA